MIKLRISKVLYGMFVVCSIGIFCAMGVSVNAETNITDETAVMSSKEQMEQEENYIVRLVSQRTGERLTTYDWKKCLTYLRENYISLMLEEGLSKDKIISYVSAYTFVEMDEEKPDEGVNFFVEPYAAYSPTDVTAYTDKYWNSHNPNYPNFDKDGFGGDCANFVSQALRAGGKAMKGTVASDFSNWFCRTNSTNALSKVSSTWRGADAFGHYWVANAKAYKKFGKSYFTSKEKFTTVFDYGSVGDAISMLNDNGRPYHTLIISYKEDKKLKFASHTDPHKWKSLYGYVGGECAIRIYKM